MIELSRIISKKIIIWIDFGNFPLELFETWNKILSNFHSHPYKYNSFVMPNPCGDPNPAEPTPTVPYSKENLFPI